MDKEIVKNLNSDDFNLISDSLKKVKESGSSDYLPLVFDLMHRTPFEELKKQIENILFQLKATDSVPYFINALNNEKYRNEREILIRSCWESGLDFSDYISVFVDIMITGNYMEALESLTLIENLEFKIGEKELDRYNKAIDKHIVNMENDHKRLMDEAKKILETKLLNH
ncbi:MAG: hypothetical protein JW798_03695 [Prolixibacteraceae bacterium]|nr:hypothetical protein [Prolixibacteraceae bacterium]